MWVAVLLLTSSFAQAITQYSGFSGDAEHPAAKMFWNVIETFLNDDRRLLLLFTWGQVEPLHSLLHNCHLVW